MLWSIKRLFLRFSRTHLFFHTNALAAHYQSCFGTHRSSRIIHYGVDIYCNRPMARIACAQQLSVKISSRFVIGLLHSYVGEQRKGILQIIKRLDDLAKQIPEKFELLVVGRGSETAKGIVSSALPVTTLPFLKHPHELANALNLCDVLLYPTQAENLSLTCLCALACGVPVISYDVGGQGEAVRNGVNGFLLPPNDEEGVLTALLKMIRDPALHQRLSGEARRTAETSFNFERYIDELIEYYYDLL
jgi:glycosyltransferase involved in cell wall biosynthesis